MTKFILMCAIAASACATTEQTEQTDETASKICTIQDCPDGPNICTVQQQMSGECYGPVTPTWSETQQIGSAIYGSNVMTAPRLNYFCGAVTNYAGWYFCDLYFDAPWCRVYVFCTIVDWVQSCYSTCS